MLYDFLKTLPPVENKVNPFPDAEPAAAAKARGLKATHSAIPLPSKRENEREHVRAPSRGSLARRTPPHLAAEPDLGVLPLAADRGRRAAENRARFLHRQPAEGKELDEARLPLVQARQLV